MSLCDVMNSLPLLLLIFGKSGSDCCSAKSIKAFLRNLQLVFNYNTEQPGSITMIGGGFTLKRTKAKKYLNTLKHTHNCIYGFSTMTKKSSLLAHQVLPAPGGQDALSSRGADKLTQEG